ncbi:hypothetical protein GCM10009799_27160 [Nocardiopsis rhodophaea]|uniref:Uncharacterized protein n=1 Tax=Nocardiopsis rhodophaea TaxID=280238 RepID=A0ABN2T4M2_9ACTN
MATYREIREVSDMAGLEAWAESHEAPIARGGQTLSGRAIYSATCGCLTLVCVTPEKAPAPLVWRSPFE